MGYYGGDWDYGDYRREISRALENKRDSVSLDTEHCSYKSNRDLVAWAEADGYTARETMDTVTINLKKKP